MEPVHEEPALPTTSEVVATVAPKRTGSAGGLQDLDNLDRFLEQEKIKNKKEPWCKLNKTVRNMKMRLFAEEYQKQHHLEDAEKEQMVQFLKDCLDRKKLQRVKDVVYDRENEVIKDIPALTYVKAARHFTLRNMDNKRVSTLKSLTKSSLKHSSRQSRQSTTSSADDAEEEDETA